MSRSIADAASARRLGLSCCMHDPLERPTTSNVRVGTLAALTLVASLAGAPAARAQSLEATDPAELGAAIALVGQTPDRALAIQLAARIDRGLPPPLLARAIDALANNGTAPALAALLDLAHHRRAAVRAHVAQSLLVAHDPNARRVLADLLDDPDGTVRSAAAVSLGEVGARGVLDTVMLAAIRGVVEAAILFGQQASASDAARVLRRADATTLEALAPALRILLQRANVSRPTKLAIVHRLGELRGALAESLLREVSAALPETDPVRRAIEEVLATDDSTGAGE
jgi:HEAT repeat protein